MLDHVPIATAFLDGMDILAELRLADFIHQDDAWLEHIPFAFWLIDALRPKSFVELGTHRGVAYFAFCQAIRDLGITTRATAVDTWLGDGGAGLADDGVFDRVQDFHEANFSAFSRLIRSSFDDAATRVPPGSIDLLHIDGLNTYEAVHHHFETWRPLLSADAVVLLHDTSVRERDFGVWRLFAELRARYPSFEFLPGQGLGVIGIGTNFPPPVAALFAAALNPQDEQAVREAFARQGAHVASRFRPWDRGNRVDVEIPFPGRALHPRADVIQRESVMQRQEIGLTAAIDEREDIIKRLDAGHGNPARDLSLAPRDTVRDETDPRLAALEAEIGTLRRHILMLRDELDRRDAQAAASHEQLAAILASTSWRMTWPLRRLMATFPAASPWGRRLLKLGWWILTGQLARHARSWLKARTARRSRVAGHADVAARVPGAAGSGRHAPAARGVKVGRPANWTLPKPRDAYECWLVNNAWNWRREQELRQRLSDAAAAAVPPLLSVLMPVYRPDPAWLDRAIDSVRRQVYDRWELCIADDASFSAELAAMLRGAAAADPRIKVAVRETNGHISRATNSAAALAGGEFYVLLDQDDELAPDALAEIALRIVARPEADLIYSDSDKIDARGRRYDPHFKPDFSPELLLGYMYAGQALTIRARLWHELGGLRVGYEGSQDHDLALRASERARGIEHIPRVLYHWRAVPGSTALSANAKSYSVDAGRKAVQDALERRGSAGVAYQPAGAMRNGNALFHVRFPDDGPSVTIVVPTRNQLPLLRRCVDSLARTRYRNFVLLVVDNDSDDPEARAWLERLPRRTDLRASVLRVSNASHGRFNFAHLINEGVAAARSDYVVLLNNDIEVINPEWLGSLVGYGRLPGVGCVGGLLRYPDGTIQHAGITQTDVPPTLVDHTFKHAAPHDAGYLGYIQLARNTVAVTAACLLVSRAIFDSVGGLDERDFGVAYNDVDFCYRVASAGYRNVYTPAAELTHHEGASRGFRDDPRELANFRARYAGRGDRYLNPNLSRHSLSLEIHPVHVAMDGRSAIRIIVVTHNLNFEGAPKAILETARCLAARGGIEVTVFSPEEGPLRAEYEAAGIRVEVVPTPLSHGPDLAAYERGLLGFAGMMQARGADVVLGNTLKTFYAIDAAHGAGIPALWVIHESEGWRDYFRFLPPEVERRALACFGHPYRVVFVAEATRRIYAELDYHRNATVIPGGLDQGVIEPFLRPGKKAEMRKALGLADTDRVIVLLGTVCERKGQIDLVGALRLIDPAGFDGAPRVFIVGDRDSPYSRDLHAAVASLPAAWRGKVTVVPETPDVWTYYAAADLFVFTSRMESYPRVILEAMAFGLPIITTPVNGIVEQVRRGVNAEFYEPGDVRALAALITDLLGDARRRAILGANSVHVLRTLNTHEDTARLIGDAVREAAVAGIAPTRLEAIWPF